jgi:hypothetical protein
MNQIVYDLIKKSEVSITSPRVFHGYLDIHKFSELVVEQCLEACRVKPTESLDWLDEYDSGVKEGYRRAVEKILHHFDLDNSEWQKYEFEVLE